MEALKLPNDGYVVGRLNKELFDSLLKEALSCESNGIVNTGLMTTSGKQTCPHYSVSKKNADDLADFLMPYINHYMENFDYVQNIGVLTSDSPLVFQEPWYNVQKPNDYLPVHMHDGVLSYSIWLKLPLESSFQFSYSSITGRSLDYGMKLSPNEAGTFLMFPSTLTHAVYPYESDNPEETRITLSGNISFRGISELLPK